MNRSKSSPPINTAAGTQKWMSVRMPVRQPLERDCVSVGFIVPRFYSWHAEGHFFFNSAVQLEMKVSVLDGWLPSYTTTKRCPSAVT
jgi:hypothetical protein